MKLFGGWLPYIAIVEMEVPHEYGSDPGTALVVGWFMRFAFFGFTEDGHFWGYGGWARK